MDELIAVLRAQTEIEVDRHPSKGTRPASQAQVQAIAGAMEMILQPHTTRELRISVLKKIFPYGVAPVESTKNLSAAEASVLIRFLFGLKEEEDIKPNPEYAEDACALLEDLASDILLEPRRAAIRRGQLEMLEGN